MWSKAGRSHVVRFYGMLKIPWGISDTDRQNSHSFVHSSYLHQMSLVVGPAESSGGQVRSYPRPLSPSPRLSMFTYHQGMNKSKLVFAVLRHVCQIIVWRGESLQRGSIVTTETYWLSWKLFVLQSDGTWSFWNWQCSRKLNTYRTK
jgi:hypothetical protein